MGKSFVDDETRRAVDTELGRGYRGNARKPGRYGRGENFEDVRNRMETWKARVDSKQRRRKKRYWMTMGWLARAPKLLMSVVVDGGLAFSILAHVR